MSHFVNIFAELVNSEPFVFRYGEHVVRPFRHDSRDLSPQVKAVISSLLLPTPSANFTPDRSVLPPSSPIQDLVPKWTLSLPSLVPPVSATQSPAPPRPSARLSMRRKIEDEERPWESYNSEDDGSESVSIGTHILRKVYGSAN